MLRGEEKGGQMVLIWIIFRVQDYVLFENYCELLRFANHPRDI